MVIGIGGISNAGKSSLALKIKSYYPSKQVTILCQDDYAFPNEKIPIIKNHIDWECPGSIDFDIYEKAVIEAIEASDIVIAEGIFAFHRDSTTKLFDKKIFLTLDSRFFFMRKNTDLRWGKEPDWYIEHIWNNHIKYCKQNIPKDAKQIRAGRAINLENIIDFLETGNVK
jgi:uridine kinase